MLETTLQQERADMQAYKEANPDQLRSAAAQDDLVSHPISHLSTPSKYSNHCAGLP